jgi:hypothetical protein
MENLLIDIYLFACHVYDTSYATCFQRLSNNRDPEFTDRHGKVFLDSPFIERNQVVSPQPSDALAGRNNILG